MERGAGGEEQAGVDGGEGAAHDGERDQVEGERAGHEPDVEDHAGDRGERPELLRDSGRAAVMGLAGRERAVAEFSWDAVAAQTAALYAELAELAGRWVRPTG